MNNTFSFIILRHVNNSKTNLYWNKCYDCIRTLYKKIHIYIIDDNSIYKPLRIGKKLQNTTIINSIFHKQRGELLPYYYFYTLKFSDNVIILHDSVFIHKKIHNKYIKTKKYVFIWHAEHKWDPNVEIENILRKLSNSKKLINIFMNKNKWNVCFGGMSIINLKFIEKLFNNNNYLFTLLSEINNRKKRQAFERIISILLTSVDKSDFYSVNGDINNSGCWFSKYEKYNNLNYFKKNMYKISSGR